MLAVFSGCTEALPSYKDSVSFFEILRHLFFFAFFNMLAIILTIEINRVFSLTWPAFMQIYWNKRGRLHKKRVQLPEDWFGTPTWPPFHCFETPIWPP